MYDRSIPHTYNVACGATAIFDYESGISYRCQSCGAVVGSIGMPRECKQLEDEAEIARRAWEILGGDSANA